LTFHHTIIPEQRSNFPAVALKLLLRSGGDDQIGNLWRKEPPQPAHAFDFVHLVGDALFKLLV
jgi:hypothetical protein